MLLEVGDGDLHQAFLGGINDAAVDEPQSVPLEVAVGYAEAFDDVGDGHGAFAFQRNGAQDLLVFLGEGGQSGKEDVLLANGGRVGLSPGVFINFYHLLSRYIQGRRQKANCGSRPLFVEEVGCILLGHLDEMRTAIIRRPMLEAATINRMRFGSLVIGSKTLPPKTNSCSGNFRLANRRRRRISLHHGRDPRSSALG